MANPAEDPAFALARRLRELRVNGLANKKITQSELSAAIDASGPLISSWESPRNPKAPPEDRLRTYATFFATERSVAQTPFRVLSTSQLTGDERARRDELLHELTSLRRGAKDHKPKPAAVDAFLRGHWHFRPDEDITIVCTALPAGYRAPMPYTDPSEPDYVELYKYADLDALFELFGHLRAANPLSKVVVRTSAEVRIDDYTSHLVLLGGVDWNKTTAELLRILPVPVEQLARQSDTESGGFLVGEGDDQQLFSPSLLRKADGEVLLDDVAHFYRTVNPHNEERTVTICNGMYARGTYGAVRALTDARFRDRNEDYLRTRFAEMTTFSILSRVKVFLGAAVTPDWNTDDLLHEWPVPTA